MVKTLRWLANPTPLDTGFSTRSLVQVAGAILLPFLLMSMYLTATRWGMGLMGNAGDTGALLVLPVIGAAIVWFSSLPLKAKIVLLVVYLPCMYYGLFVFSLAFVGYVFGHWL